MKHPYDHFIVEAILDLAQARQWLSILINHYLSLWIIIVLRFFAVQYIFYSGRQANETASKDH